MRILQSVLKEELANSLRMARTYEAAWRRLPKGVIVRKQIRGHGYYYLLRREGGRVRFHYLGRRVDPDLARRHREAKRLRAKYRTLLATTRRQITFLQRALRGRTRRAVA